MATYSLDQLKADVDKQYTGLVLDVGEDDQIVLANLLRLPREDRAKVGELLEVISVSVEDNDLDTMESASVEVLSLAAGKRGKDLVKLIGDDAALALDLLSKWTENTQVGEAEPSQG